MDPNLSGAFVGLTLATKPEQLYRALIESTAFGVRWIVETLQDSGVPVRRFVASGGLPSKNPLLMQIYADVLGEKINIAASDQSVALGAAILGCLAAGEAVTGYAHASQAIHAMARQREDLVYRPDLPAKREYGDYTGCIASSLIRRSGCRRHARITSHLMSRHRALQRVLRHPGQHP
jgi:L-ribulokinase